MTAATVGELVTLILPRLERAQGGGDNISARCPFDDHEDRAASFSINRKTGLWKCHGRCHRQGNAWQLAKELGVLPATTGTPSRKAPPGVDWGLDGAMKKFGVTATDRAAVFPVYDDEGNPCRRHVRYHEGSPRFQFWDGKAGRRTYHALVAWDLIRAWGQGCGIAYVCEGNRDWLTLAGHDWPAVGVLGIDHFDACRQEVFPHLKAAGIGAIVITPDNDVEGLKAAQEWAPALEADGFTVGVRVLPLMVCGKTVKDTFDAFTADPAGFDDLMHDLPVQWRA